MGTNETGNQLFGANVSRYVNVSKDFPRVLVLFGNCSPINDYNLMYKAIKTRVACIGAYLNPVLLENYWGKPTTVQTPTNTTFNVDNLLFSIVLYCHENYEPEYSSTLPAHTRI